MTRRAVIVLGMHRAGTSALTRVMSLLGLDLPATLMAEQADNPTGFWESTRVARLNNALLQRAGRSWLDPRPLLPITEDARQTAIGEAVLALQEQWPDGGPIILKDPRISRLGHIWLPALERAGLSPRFIVMLRHPGAVADSLRTRNGFKTGHSRLLWLAHYLEAWSQQGSPRTVVCYDDLLSDWLRTVQTVIQRLDLDVSVTPAAADAIDAFLSPTLRHHDGQRESAPAGRADLADVVWTALRAAATTGDNPGLTLEIATHAMARDLFAPAWDDLCPEAQDGSKPSRATGPAVGPAVADAAAGKQPPPPPARPVIIHYNLFMNAGNLVTRLLRRNFGSTYHEYNGTRPELSPSDLTTYLRGNPWIAALSSHRAQLPPPEMEGIKAFPLLFVRHPLDRARLIYEFERGQNATTPGPTAAKSMTLPDYVAWRLEQPGDMTIANFHTCRLARHGRGTTDLDRARNAFATLPFVGLVEDFGRSLDRLQAILRPHFPQLEVRLDASTPAPPGLDQIDARLVELRAMLGDGLYQRLLDANQDDIHLWEMARDTG